MRLSDQPQRKLKDEEAQRLRELGDAAWDHYEPRYLELIAEGALQQAWLLWSHINEGILLAWYDERGDLDPTVDRDTYLGRGHAPALKVRRGAAMAKLGERHGSLGSQESELMGNILRLKETRTGEILTPRTVVTALDVNQSVAQALELLEEVPFTRIPVYEGDVDSVVGVVLKPKLLELDRHQEADTSVTDCVLPVHRVSEELPVLHLLDQFIKRREHLFLVEDEYGQTSGIVTLEDAVETLLGREIMDESDTVEDMQQLAKSNYRQRLRRTRAETWND